MSLRNLHLANPFGGEVRGGLSDGRVDPTCHHNLLAYHRGGGGGGY